MCSLPVPTSSVSINNATYTVSELTLGVLESFLTDEAKALESKSVEAFRTYRLSVVAWSLNRAQGLEGDAAHTVESLKKELGPSTLDALFNKILVLSGLKTDKPQEGEASASQSS